MKKSMWIKTLPSSKIQKLLCDVLLKNWRNLHDYLPDKSEICFFKNSKFLNLLIRMNKHQDYNSTMKKKCTNIIE